MDFFKEYFKFVGETEAPNIYHRWCAISALSSTIGREVFFPFGHKPIYPNLYILLMGAPGARKSTGLGISKDLLTRSGYTRLAKERSSKERFFSDMAHKIDPNEIDLEELVLDAPSEVTISNGEFLDFIGQGNMDFLTALTNLWDNLPHYEHPKLHGKSVFIHKPTVNILGGATVKGLGMAIPPEALGTGILSRLILVYSEPTGKKITFPEEVAEDASDRLVEFLKDIRSNLRGKMTKTPEASGILHRMYQECPGIEDPRFVDYSSRRFIHLLKLSMIMAISRNSLEISDYDALRANTILHATELRMSKALGEFGKSKYSDVSNTIMDALGRAHKPMSQTELWKLAAKDLSDIRDLSSIMKNLLTSEKVQVITVAGRQGYMPRHVDHKEWDKSLLLPDYLTGQELF